MNGWQTKTLGEVAEVIAGQSPDGKAYNVDGKGMPFYQGKKKFGEKHIGEPTTWTTEITRVAHKGDVLMSVRAPVGPVNFATQEMCIGRGLAAIRARTGLDRNFLYNFLLHIRGEIEGTEGAVFASINKGQIEIIDIPVPPLPEQQRIVGILDEAFAGIAKARANAENNFRNARELFESHLNAAFTQLGDGWTEKSLIDACGLFFDSAHRTPKYQAEGIPALRPRDVVNGMIDLERAAKVSRAEFAIQSKRYELQSGDIVYSRELSLGWAAIVPPAAKVCLSQGMCVFRPVHDINAEYVVFVLNSPFGRSQAIKAAVGTAHPHINLGDIKTYRIPIPPTRLRAKVVGAMRELQDQTQRLESLYQQKLTALDALKKSLLYQAFSGHL